MLLVALILFLRSLAPRTPAAFRVLVAAHTNAAVDRILLGLAAQGFTGKTSPRPRLLQLISSHWSPSRVSMYSLSQL